MSDAVRNVTIVVNLKPGEIIPPRTEWIQQAADGIESLKEQHVELADLVGNVSKETSGLTKKQDELAEMVKKTKEESAELAKTQTEAAETHKKLYEEQKATLVPSSSVASAIKQEFADNQKLYEEEQKKAQRRREEALRQVRELEELRKRTGAKPLRDPLEADSGGGQLSTAHARRNQQHLDQHARNRQIEQEREEAEEDRRERAREMRERQREQREQREHEMRGEAAVRQRELQDLQQAAHDEEQMPHNMRRVTTSAGQTVASVTRLIGSLAMLKNIGGESLEELAKKFVGVNSKVMVINSTVAAFRNAGNMLDGMVKTGQATERIVTQLQKMNEETTTMQHLTINVGRAAGFVATALPPVQMGVTAITAGLVLADLTMGFFTESTAEARRKSQELTHDFNEGLSKVNESIKAGQNLLSGQTDIMKAQWEIKKAMADESGLTAEERARQQEETRQRSDADMQRMLRDSASTIIEAEMPDDLKKDLQEINKAREKKKREAAALQLLLQDKGELDNWQMVQAEYDRVERDIQSLDTKEKNRRSIHLGIAQSAKDITVKDGIIQNLDEVVKNFEKLPKEMQKTGDVFMTNLKKQVIDSSLLLASQASDAKQRARAAEREQKQQETTLKDLTHKRDDEIALSERFKLKDSAMTMTYVDQLLNRAETAKPDVKEYAIADIKKSLEQSKLMTPDLSRILSRGASADVGEVRTALKNAEEFTEAERREYDTLIEKANKAIARAEQDAMDTAAVAAKLERLLENNQRQLEALNRAIESRDQN